MIIWLASSFKFAVVYQISSKSDDFSLRYNDLTICNVPGRALFCFPVPNFTEIGQLAAEL